MRRYHPDLTGSLAPDGLADDRDGPAARALHGDAIRVVFIGPCIAKKREAVSPDLGGEVDEALTFTELRRMLTARGLDLDEVAPGDFDPPHARGGGLFPISGGMLQVAGIQEDLVTGHVMVGEGPAEFAQAIKEAETGIMETRLLELLFCKGCTMGPGMSSDLPHFGRRARVSQFVRRRIAGVDAGEWAGRPRALGRPRPRRASYSPFDLRMPVPVAGGARPPARRARQARPAPRAELRRVRLLLLPRTGQRHLRRPGRADDVPAAQHRATAQHGA